MKKIIAAMAALAVPAFVFSAPQVWKSSNTATADSVKALCTKGNSQKGIFHGACVNTGAAGTLTIYNARATAANPVAALNTAAAGCFYYDVALSSGIVYTNSATANVTLLYDCY